MKMIESKTLDSTTASFFYEIGFAFNIADSLGFAALVDQCQPAHLHTHTSTISFMILQHVVEYLLCLLIVQRHYVRRGLWIALDTTQVYSALSLQQSSSSSMNAQGQATS